ncbi:MAG: carbohydrate kinase family protein [Paracoccaceae bacterium]|nr:carbohydrate kinase family protein [Paracoccaceae bacterium]
MTAARSGVICAGNWIVDIVHDIPAYPAESNLAVISDERTGIGGGAANVALNLAALGGGYPVLPLGVIGADDHGDTVIAVCGAAGLPVASLARRPGVATAHTHVMNVTGASRTFFYHPGANEHLGPDAIAAGVAALPEARLFYLGYLTLLPRLDAIGPDGRTEAARALGQARAAGMTTCLDLVSSESARYAETVFATLPEVDWLFLNEIEAARATGVAIAGETDRDGMAGAAGALVGAGLGKGCILHTPQLTLWKERDREFWFEVEPLPKSEIVSAVGAGDAFAAGVLHGLHEGWAPGASVRLGHRLAAACLRAPTAIGDIPSLDAL